MSLLISIRSESFKLKRTLSVYICLSAAAFAALMTFLEYIDLGPTPRLGKPWTEHFMRGQEPLCFILLPLYVILTSTLLLQIEYKDKTWKQLLSSPQRLLHIFLGKFIVLQLMILFFLIAHHFFQWIAAMATELIHPELYNGTPDFYQIAIADSQAYILVLGVSSIQFWLSFRFRSFMASLAIGFGLWFIAAMVAFVFKWSIVEYYPYAFTMLGVWSKYEANSVYYQWYSIITAVLFLGIGFAEFSKRKIKS